MNIQFKIFIVAAALIWSSCDTSNKKGTDYSLPTSIGNPHQMLLVGDEKLMKSDLYDTIDYHVAEVFKIVPNFESMIDINVVTPDKFLGYLKQRRTIMFVESLDANTSVARLIRDALGEEKIRKAKEDTGFRFAVRRNKWAKGQQIIYVFAPTRDELPDAVKRAAKQIIKKVYDFDQPLVDATAFAGGLNKAAMADMKSKLDLIMDLPKGYRTVSNEYLDDNTMWFKNEVRKIEYNIVVHKMEYGEENKPIYDNIIKYRNQLGKKYVSTRIKDAYMTTETKNRPFPVFAETSINGNYAIEARGVFKMVNDFMGGPFISYLIYNPNKNMVVFIDGFIIAPAKETHKEPVLQMDRVMQTLKF